MTFRRVVALALPAAAASAATPLLGVVDAWVLGRSAMPLEVGAVGLATAIFSTLYWTLGFLRMSTAALAARSAGVGDEPEARAVLARAVLFAMVIGIALLVFRPLIEPLALSALRAGSAASAHTFEAAQAYFRIRLWAAPFALATYALTGWLTGRGRTAVAMAATVTMTALNGLLDWIFVVRSDMGAEGIALGTAIAEAAGFGFMAVGALFVLSADGVGRHWHRAFARDARAFAELFAMNRDIFIRTLLIVAAFAFFTQRSSSWGDVTLAANQILVQLFLLTGLALDGPAIAAESLVGSAVARRNRRDYRATLRYAGQATAIAAAPFALAYAAWGQTIAQNMTVSATVAERASEYMPWVAISPLVVALSFLLDGVFVGAARGRDMRDTMLVSAAIYVVGWLTFTALWGAHGHWAAFMLFFAARGATMLVRLPAIEAGLAPKSDS